MKIAQKFLLGLSFSILLVSASSFNVVESNVYICEGKYSKKYHFSKTCRGLSNCKASVVKITLKGAKEKGRTLCGWED